MATPRKRPAAGFRSLLEMSTLLGIGRETLKRWAEREGAPFASRPTEGSGAESWQFDPPAVIRWFADREAEAAVRKAVSGLTGVTGEEGEMLDTPPETWSEDEADRRRAIYLALEAKRKYLEATGKLAPIADTAAATAADCALVRRRLLAVEGELRRDGEDPQTVVRVMRTVNAALGHLQVDRVMAERAAAAEAEDDEAPTPAATA